MKNCLIDSHALLWYLEGNAKLSSKAKTLIEDSTSDRFVSFASLWEIGIKLSTKRLYATFGMADLIQHDLPNNGWKVLAIDERHVREISNLAFPSNGHRDPFDRMLVVQALCDDLSLISYDEALDAYGVRRVW